MEEEHVGVVHGFGFNGPYGYIHWEKGTVFFHIADGRVPVWDGDTIKWRGGKLRTPVKGDLITFVLSMSDPKGPRAASWIFTDAIPAKPEFSSSGMWRGRIVLYNPMGEFAFAAVAGIGDFYLRKSCLRVPIIWNETVKWSRDGRHAVWDRINIGDEVLLTEDPTRMRRANEWVLAQSHLACQYQLPVQTN